METVVTALVVGDNSNNGRGGRDAFHAVEVMLYITYLTVGYMVARGLTKSGHSHTTHA